MNLTYLKNLETKLLIAAILLFLNSIKPAYSQINGNYGLNNSGIRISGGLGLNVLETHFSDNPVKPSFIGNLDYDVNPYLGFGVEGQAGQLQGLDKVNHLPYSSSTNNFLAGNINFRVAVGLVYDFESQSMLQDALKRIYIGAGIGAIKNNIKLGPDLNPNDVVYGTRTDGKNWVYPINVGTNIDLHGILGRDVLSINPDYQFNIINSGYADGFNTKPSAGGTGYYIVYAIKVKLKF